jgi:DNA-directed RNA polymerase subunit beta'
MPDNKSQALLSRLMAMENDARNNVLMNVTVKDAAAKILKSVEDEDVKLKVNKIWVEDKRDNRDVASQKDVRMKGQIWGNDLKADLELVDKLSGKTIDHVPSVKISNIPKITDRGTYIVKGNEYQFTKQSRLRPGVYTKRQTNGEISSFFNVDKTIDFERGFNNNFKINFNPEKKTFTMGYGSKNIPLYNALLAVGVTDKEMRNVWGNDVFAANSSAYAKHEIRDQNKFYEAIFGRQPRKELNGDQVRAEIKKRIFETKLDGETTKITLGKSYNEVGKGPLLDASKKIIDIHKGTAESDDRESLIFKSFYDIEDHIREKMVKNSGRIINNIKHKLKKNRAINKALSSQTFDPFVVGTVTTSQLSNPPSQTNPMSIIGESSKITVMGEGGIGSTNAVTNETRQISNSEAGFIDSLHTPEGSSSIGVTVHSAMDTVKIGPDLYSKFKNKKGETQMLKPLDVYNKNVAFPDQFDMSQEKPAAKTKTVNVVHQGKFKIVNADKVDVIIDSPVGMFDTSTNMIPFLDSIQGSRGLTAAKMQEQALSLKNRDKPLFAIVNQRGKIIGEALGSYMGVPKAIASGKVASVTKDEITIKDKDGKVHKHQLYNDFSLNSESYINNEPLVKPGDEVKKDQALADNNFTRDGQMALGANLNVAYMPYKGYNYEDSAILSESAAKKLTSNHMYDLKTKRSSKGVFSKEKFKAYYPEELNAKNSLKLDREGVVKVGQTLERGDVAIAYMERKEPTADDLAIGRLDKQLKRDMGDNAVRWENDHKGVVTGVQKHGNSVIINVKTEEPLKVADKISGLHGNKHIISKIVPDHEMPYNPETGEKIDLTMSPIGVTNRINTSQLLENAAGKIAKKTGEQYRIMNFEDVDNSRKVMDELKKVGLSDKDILIDPETNKPFINPISNGVSHIIKLEHKVDHKFSARYKDGYDSNEQPITGGETGGKKIGRMEMAALLARGATENLKEMFQVKGQRNDEYWRAMETGQSLPPPKNSFVWDKMLANMAGAGIDVEQKGKTFTLKPMTDNEILDRSKGELKRPWDTYRKKDLAPMREGLFDPAKAGGMQGEHYTHFKLPEKVLNPVTARAAATLLDMPLKRLEEVIVGKQFVNKATGQLTAPGTPNSISGGPAVELMLGKIKVDEDLKQANTLANITIRKPELDKLHKKIRVLRSLKNEGMNPTDYMIGNVLVTPSKYRPMFAMGTNGTVIMSDINDLYQQTAYSSEAIKSLKDDLKASVPDADIQNLTLAEARGQLYKDVKAVAGLQEPTSYLHRVKNKKGFINQIDGGKEKQTKEGFFQNKVVERRQDLVGRSTIILNPELGGDQIGIPKEMASKIFRPFIMKKLVSWGYTPLEAKKEIDDNTKVFERARQVVTDDRLVIANRAPSLHRWNMTAFKPKLTDGKSIEVPGIVISENFGGDFDGDTFQIHTPISAKAQEEAEKMKPSASMLKTGFDSVLNAPEMDMVVGTWLASQGKGGKKIDKEFESLDEARQSFKNHNLTYADNVNIKGRRAPLAMHEANSVIPEDAQRWDVSLDKDQIDDWIRDVTKKHNGKMALGLADKLKDVGNNYATKFGFTLGISDTIADKNLRDSLVGEAKKEIGASKNPDKIVSAFYNATLKGKEQMKEKHGSSTMLGIGMNSGGSKGIDNVAAISLMPGIVTDANDRPIPIPITKSYSEGLNTFDYWTAAHGARGGNIKKSVSSFMPGWMTKDLMNSIYDTRIHADEPVDKEGFEYETTDKKGIVNRYLARDAKTPSGRIIAKRNEIVNSDTMNKLVKNKIKSVFVQSPITDPSSGDGFSSYSYGVDYEGKRHNVGDNIGVISAHTLTEPSLKMAMKAFHTGGALQKGGGVGSGTVFDRLDRTLRFTRNLPDKATLSSLDGTVKSVNKSPIGGYDVLLQNKDKEEARYIDPNNDVLVRKGQEVRMGDKLSTGTPSAHDMLKYKGMKETQKFLVKEIDKINDGKLDKRDIETIVRGISNTTRVLNSGDNTNLVAGDVTQLTTVEKWNKDAGKIGAKPVKHEPFLTPTGIQAKAQASENWIARLAHNRIKRVLEEGTTQGWKTTIDPEKGHPLPTYITGTYTW